MVKQREKSRGKKGTCLKQICIYMYIYIRTQDNTHGVSFVSASPFVSTPLMVLYRKSAKNTHRCFCFQPPQRKKANDRAEFLLIYIYIYIYIYMCLFFFLFSLLPPLLLASHGDLTVEGARRRLKKFCGGYSLFIIIIIVILLFVEFAPRTVARKKKKTANFLFAFAVCFQMSAFFFFGATFLKKNKNNNNNN